MGINIVTPNKKGTSSDQSLYQAITDASYPNSPGVLLGESTVGAGLPILSTLKDLVNTGDEIEKIEGVFSGTLSYIFNEFSKVEGGDVKFSEVVKIAKDKGYTVSGSVFCVSGSRCSPLATYPLLLSAKHGQALGRALVSVGAHSFGLSGTVIAACPFRLYHSHPSFSFLNLSFQTTQDAQPYCMLACSHCSMLHFSDVANGTRRDST